MSRKTALAERLQRIMTEKGLSQSGLARGLWGTTKDERGYTVARNRQVVGKYLRGAGIYVEAVDHDNKHIELSLDAPNEVVRKLVLLASPYAV